MNLKNSILCVLILYLVHFISIGPLQCQSIEKILSEKDISTIRERVKAYLKEHPDATGILYLRALIETDGKKAIEHYEQLIRKYPTSSYTDDARFKIAQYYYAREFYQTARKKFQEIINLHSRSPLRDDAAYFAAQCLIAMNNQVAGNRELETFINRYPDSPLCKLAQNELKAQQKQMASSGRRFRRRSGARPGEWQSLQRNTTIDKNKKPDSNSASKSGDLKSRYALQVGAFSSLSNALSQKRFFQNKGYTVDISTKKVSRKTLYAVLLNRFSSRDAAKILGEKLKWKYNINYVIVELP